MLCPFHVIPVSLSTPTDHDRSRRGDGDESRQASFRYGIGFID